ncbi:hypothetical protein KFL_000770170 [Klebsormidium nitens]|uniref:NHL repeat-containing protein n=1 Tax=Klebsormidium nitens TaxID=105231 RepID=A0A1Y1HRR1_KLENI|nr:hypothetical protein KFL_000770170 [Klebsormidium nitens]|eukprot:GAQ81324.1 hypothetical protein KFL_000770170 [Klebsormidium nitens]
MARFSGVPFLLVLLACVAASSAHRAKQTAFVAGLTNKTVASTVPSNGDVTPYGCFVVPRTVGKLRRDNVLINAAEPVGLSTALVVLQSGWVIVGNTPTTDGTSNTIMRGSIFVLDAFGTVRAEIKNSFINGPWGATVAEFQSASIAYLFVSNVVAPANGTIVRWTLTDIMRADDRSSRPPRFTDPTIIADNIGAVLDPAAVVIGPVGLGYRNNQLFVSDEVHNRVLHFNNVIFRGNPDTNPAVVTSDNALQQPIGLTLTPNQNQALIVNNLNGNLVDFTIPAPGTQLATVTVSNFGAGSLFGLAATINQNGQKKVYFVNDGDNTLNVLE